MKKIVFVAIAIFVSLTAVTATACASYNDERPIEYNELPAEAKSFVGKYFADEKISHVVREREFIGSEYTLVFMNGTKIEFNNSGEWREISCRNSAVPEVLVPAAIEKMVRERYPDRRIIELKCDSREWEVKLEGGLELTFNKEFRLMEIDD